MSFAAGISRFASTYDGLAWGFIVDGVFERIVERDVREGQYRNPTKRAEWFTTAYFHDPRELEQELLACSFHDVRVYAVEGPAGFLPDLDRWLDDTHRSDVLLRTIRRVEREESIMGASPHLLASGSTTRFPTRPSSRAALGSETAGP